MLSADAAADADGDVVLVRPETSPEDVHGMSVAVGILTSTGGLVSHAAVVAMPDALMGERACAFVIAPPGTKPSELRRFLRGQGLADFKLPDRFVFVPDLPKTAVGKVDKQTLRERARKDNASMETTAS